VPPKKKPRAPRPVTVAKKDQEELLELVRIEEGVHLHALSKLKQVLDARNVSKIGAKMAGIVGALERMYPLIRWSLRAVVHGAAVDRSAFATERKLAAHRLDLPPRMSMLQELERMV
jgi:hypothetical protein